MWKYAAVQSASLRIIIISQVNRQAGAPSAKLAQTYRVHRASFVKNKINSFDEKFVGTPVSQVPRSHGRVIGDLCRRRSCDCDQGINRRVCCRIYRRIISTRALSSGHMYFVCHDGHLFGENWIGFCAVPKQYAQMDRSHVSNLK